MLISCFNTDGNLIADPIFGGYQYDYGNEYGRRAWNATNGIADAIYDLDRFNSNTLLGNFNVGVKLTDWASIDVRYISMKFLWTCLYTC